jgi:hypothetical protein
MYRPTVRYDDSYRVYVDDLYKATHLDRNQILRCALFAASLSREFSLLLSPYRKRGVDLPKAPWRLEQHGYWLEQSMKKKKEEKIIVRDQGGIVFKLE